MKSDSIFLDLLFQLLKIIAKACILALYLTGRVIELLIKTLNQWMEQILNEH